MLRVNGFYGHVKNNDLRSAGMFVGFIVAFELAAAVALAVPFLILDGAHSPLFHPGAYFARYGLLVFWLGVGLFLIQAGRYVDTICASSRFAYVDRRSCPRLAAIVETLAIAAGTPQPKIAVIDTHARNAFACGISAGTAVVVVTRGLIEALDDDELSAVMAHEIAHIRNGDMRLMAAANILLGNLLLVSRHNLLRVRGNKTIVLMVLLPPFALLFLAAGLINGTALMIGKLSRLLISSSREFIADAEAVRLTHNPAALISALKRIEGLSKLDGMQPQAGSMMIDGPTEGDFATHPTIGERISVLSRLAGGMAHIPMSRKDTRPVALQMAHAGRGFGRKGAIAPLAQTFPAASAPQEETSLVKRVQTGSERNIFGLTPRLARNLKVGFILYFFFAVVLQWLIVPSVKKNINDQEFVTPTDSMSAGDDVFRSLPAESR